jgi:hypothetical protein
MKQIIRLAFLAASFCCCTLLVAAEGDLALDEPVLITSAGQSADVSMAELLCKKAGVKATVLPMAGPGDLKEIKTLIIVAGFSSKGLGAAGVSREEEMERVEEIIRAAEKKTVPILMMHVGGTARRGGQSDDFNKAAAEAADCMIVVKKGDEDGLFSTIASERKVPLYLVDKMSGAVAPLQQLFPTTDKEK